MAAVVALFIAISVFLSFAVYTSNQTKYPTSGYTAYQNKGEYCSDKSKKPFWVSPGCFFKATASDPINTFTAALVALTAVLAGVSIIQIRFLISADKNAISSSFAASKAAEAALKQVEIMVITQRAYLRDDEIEVLPSQDETKTINAYGFQLNYKNTGVTSAYDVRISIACRFVAIGNASPPDVDYEKHQNPVTTVVGPGVVLGTGWKWFGVNKLAMVYNDIGSAFLYIRILYKDVFSEEVRTVEACHKLIVYGDPTKGKPHFEWQAAGKGITAT